MINRNSSSIGKCLCYSVIVYEISFAIKDLDGAHEMGVLADNLTRERVNELLLDLPNTWKRDTVALIIRDQATRNLEILVLVYIDEDDFPFMVIFNQNHEYSVDGKTFHPHDRYASISDGQYLFVADECFSADLHQTSLRDVFMSAASVVNNPVITTLVDKMTTSKSSRELDDVLTELQPMIKNNITKLGIKTTTANLLFSCKYFIQLIHGGSTMKRSSVGISMRANLPDVFTYPENSEKFFHLNRMIADIYRSNVSFVDFMYLYWSIPDDRLNLKIPSLNPINFFFNVR